MRQKMAKNKQHVLEKRSDPKKVQKNVYDKWLTTNGNKKSTRKIVKIGFGSFTEQRSCYEIKAFGLRPSLGTS